MNAKKFFYVSSATVGILLVLLGASLYFMNKYLQKGSDALVQAKLDSRVTEEREKFYIQAKKDLDKYKDIDATLSKVLPKDKDQAVAVAEIGRIADETGIEIKQISFPSSTLGEKKAVAAATTGSTATPAKPAVPTITQAKPVDGVNGVLGIDTQIQFISTGAKPLTYQKFLTFLEKIEKNRRTMQVTSISITPQKNGLVDASIAVRIFVKP
jgi:hypothetical protein